MGLEDVDWLDDTTKHEAMNKLSTMKYFVGYPDEILNKTIVEEHFSGIEITEDDYFGNFIRLVKWNQQFQFSRLNKEVEKTAWIDHSLVLFVDAFYDLHANAIRIPAGILQGVTFSESLPNYLNFGAIEQSLHMRLTHGFDNLGANYDAKARYYSTGIGMTVNGIATRGENIADNGGVKAAYHAY
ncbi:unnamed protein product, partial [Sphagnum tenellum]